MHTINPEPLLIEARQVIELADQQHRDLLPKEARLVGALLDAVEALGSVAQFRGTDGTRIYC